MTAIVLDSATQTLVIETDDVVTFAGKSVKVVIEAD